MNDFRYVVATGKFIQDQLNAASVTLDDPGLDNLLDKAGGGLSVYWIKRLIDLQVSKMTIRPLIALRRLFQEPIDTIIGLEYTKPANRSKMAGLRSIRQLQGIGRKPKSHKRILDAIGCSSPITSRIEHFSSWAVLNKVADIDTPADKIDKMLKDTFSLPILISLKWELHSNIDDILGLGKYDPDAACLVGINVRSDIVPEWTEEDERRKAESDKAIFESFERNRQKRESAVLQSSDKSLTFFRAKDAD